jgi:transcriptional regulator with XRE-family HTH domain
MDSRESYKAFVGSKIRELRRSTGRSQSELAAAMNTGQPEVSEWERGKVLPSLDTVLRICGLCGVTLAYFDPAGDGHRRREEMFVAAKWMEITAEELRERARAKSTPPVSARDVEEADAEDTPTGGDTDRSSA